MREFRRGRSQKSRIEIGSCSPAAPASTPGDLGSRALPRVVARERSRLAGAAHAVMALARTQRCEPGPLGAGILAPDALRGPKRVRCWSEHAGLRGQRQRLPQRVACRVGRHSRNRRVVAFGAPPSRLLPRSVSIRGEIELREGDCSVESLSRRPSAPSGASRWRP